MIDLHLHTYFSDGSLSPEAVVERAKKLGMTEIAITDHDGTFGLSRALEAGKKEGISVLTGIELSTYMQLESQEEGGRKSAEMKEFYLHILGYCFDPKNLKLNQKVEEIQEKRWERNQIMMAALRELGYPLKWSDLELYPGQSYIGKPSFARALVNLGYAKDAREAFHSEEMMRAPKIRAIHREKISVEEAIALIHGAGGVAVLAHPMQVTYDGRPDIKKISFEERKYGEFRKQLLVLIQGLKELGLEGMECYYSKHTGAETQWLLKIAAEKGLGVTAGSDFHGPDMNTKPEIGTFQIKVEEASLKWLKSK